jgi:mono/diheme cytochrome c family protein
MSKLVEGLTLLAVCLPVHAMQAADPAGRVEGGAVVPASAQPDATLPASDPATLFAQHCAVCHKPADLVRRVQGAGDPETAKASLTTFLARHGRADAAADAAIIDWLLNSGTR